MQNISIYINDFFINIYYLFFSFILINKRVMHLKVNNMVFKHLLTTSYLIQVWDSQRSDHAKGCTNNCVELLTRITTKSSLYFSEVYTNFYEFLKFCRILEVLTIFLEI
jgi:hypothetical protein